MQSFASIQAEYQRLDPWGYKSNPDDQKRKRYIMAALMMATQGRPYEYALDIGCGEGFITRDLPARYIYGYDCSKTAMSRLPEHVRQIDNGMLTGKYDLVITTGTLYHHYMAVDIIETIRKHASGIVLTSHIRHWELPEVAALFPNQLFEMEFPYNSCGNDYVQKLRVFQV